MDQIKGHKILSSIQEQQQKKKKKSKTKQKSPVMIIYVIESLEKSKFGMIH